MLAGLGNASQFIQSDPGPAVRHANWLLRRWHLPNHSVVAAGQIVFGSFLKLLDMRVAATPRRPLHVPPPVLDGVRACVLCTTLLCVCGGLTHIDCCVPHALCLPAEQNFARR